MTWHYVEIPETSSQRLADIHAWIAAQGVRTLDWGNDWHVRHERETYRFRDASVALLFKLTWGGA